MLCPACGQAPLTREEPEIEWCPACCWVWCDTLYDLPFFVPERDNWLCSMYVKAHRVLDAN